MHTLSYTIVQAYINQIFKTSSTIFPAIKPVAFGLSNQNQKNRKYLQQMRIKTIDAPFTYRTKGQDSSFPFFPSIIPTSRQLSLHKFS